VLECARSFEFGLAFYDPGIGSLFAVEGLGLAMHGLAACLDDDLGGERFGAIFPSSIIIVPIVMRRWVKMNRKWYDIRYIGNL
jgi:hypothetical protein